jgi:hypothetical protein
MMCRSVYDVPLPNVTCLGKSCTNTGLYKPLGLEKVEAPRYQDNRHMNVTRLSALNTGRLHSPGYTTGTNFR